MSGGVDSSVAAALLQEAGFNVVGAHIKCYNLDGCGEKDAEDARRVAEQLKIPFYVFDLEKEYKEKVVQYMINGYRAGLTPNPDVMCNKEIKFGLFLKKALALGTDYIATGHYARIKRVAPVLREKSSHSLYKASALQEQEQLLPAMIHHSAITYNSGERKKALCHNTLGHPPLSYEIATLSYMKGG